MALYWPDEKVALDIVDDPERNPFEGGDDYTVLRVTCAELMNYDSFCGIMRKLSDLLGNEIPTSPEWRSRNKSLHHVLAGLMANEIDEMLDEACCGTPCCDNPEPYAPEAGLDSVELLAANEEEAERMRCVAQRDGRTVRKVSLWDGPVPEGSFEVLSSGVRMSTPEYFFFRKANQLSFVESVQLGLELCGRYRTSITQYNAGDGYDYLPQPRTSTTIIRSYLRGARGSKEYKRARRVLDAISNDAGSPMGTYLFLRLCLSRGNGGYGLPKAELASVFESDGCLMPSASGPYLAYDLVWPRKRTALQYVGTHLPNESHLDALAAGNMSIVCVTDDDLRGDKSFDRAARKLAKFLDVPIPNDTDKWKDARKRLRKNVSVPAYPNMRLTIRDIESHSC